MHIQSLQYALAGAGVHTVYGGILDSPAESANKYQSFAPTYVPAASDLPTLCVAQGEPSVAHGPLPFLFFSFHFLLTSKLCLFIFPSLFPLHTPFPPSVALYSSVASGFH